VLCDTVFFYVDTVGKDIAGFVCGVSGHTL